MKPVLLLAILGVLTVPAPAFAQDPNNPRPLPDDLVLPMPNGLSMVFRPVFLGVGDGPFALKEFTMGSRAGEGFREAPTKVQLGGSFLGENAGKRDWLFYLGKYEVTESQFAAVLPETAKGSTPSANLPKTNVTWLEVEAFLQRYNLWLFANARDRLPEADGTPGFVRLPTEQEWEFAARGGTAVDADRFDQRVPYSGELVRYEWFGGPRSSHDKLKAIGLLQPNPLGLHDMLGNAAEWVTQAYQIEYTQGRVGGRIVRGGDFRSPEEDLRSSLRIEQPPYTADFQPARADTIGFRIALSSSVFTSIRVVRNLEAAWAAYTQTRVPPMPPSLTTEPVIEQTSVGLQGVEGVLKELEASLRQGGPALEVAKAKISLIRNSFKDIEANIHHGEEKSAEGGVRLASVASQVTALSLQRLPLAQRLLASATEEERPASAKRVRELETNLTESRSTYESACQQLVLLSPEVVERKFGDWIAELNRRNLLEQARATEIARKNCAEYFRTKRLDLDQWLKGLEGLRGSSDVVPWHNGS